MVKSLVCTRMKSRYIGIRLNKFDCAKYQFPSGAKLFANLYIFLKLLPSKNHTKFSSIHIHTRQPRQKKSGFDFSPLFYLPTAKERERQIKKGGGGAATGRGR